MATASDFIRNRNSVITITRDRISNILWYLSECYLIMQNTRPLLCYSKSKVSNTTTHKFEDYLKFRFIDDFLVPNKNLLKDKISELEEITFIPEAQKTFIDSTDDKEKPDKIDIYITKLGLQKEWREEDENLYFAVECKRLKDSASFNAYIKDIEKQTIRNYSQKRLPFEGMIGFIEVSTVTHKEVSEEINNRLNNSNTINTANYLTNFNVNINFFGSYMSQHYRNFGNNDLFILYHLFFDYSKNITD